jgi:hypothetical protein
MNTNIRKYRDKQRQDDGLPLLDAYYSIPPNTINTDTTLQLVGEEIEQYSKYIFENLTWILENFSGINPPDKAVRGQIWHRMFDGNPYGQLYLYTGEDFRDGGNSADVATWTPLTEDLEGLLNAHISNLSNPHHVTKEQLGLGNVDNVPALEKGLNLSDVSNKISARSNLSLYGTADVYNKTQTNSLFLNTSSPSQNSLLLGGQSDTFYVSSTIPVITRHIDLISINGTNSKKTLLSINSGKQSITVKDGTSDLAFLSGIDLTNKIIQNNDSGIRVSFVNETVDPTWSLTLYSQGAAGSSTVAKTYTLDSANFRVGTNRVYHTSFKPTPAQLGVYATNDTVSNSLLLNGYTSSNSLLYNTILERDGSGNVSVNGLKITTPLQFTPLPTANVVFRNDSSSDTKLRLASAQTLYTWLNPASGSQPQSIVAQASFSGGSGTASISSGATISKLSTGKFRVTFNSPRANTNYSVVLGSIDDGTIYNRGEVTGALSILKGWVSNVTTASFDISVKEITSTYSQVGAQHWHQYYSQYKDTTSTISFFVYSS